MVRIGCCSQRWKLFIDIQVVDNLDRVVFVRAAYEDAAIGALKHRDQSDAVKIFCSVQNSKTSLEQVKVALYFKRKIVC